eukprot:591715-Amphidinium_carterae.1
MCSYFELRTGQRTVMLRVAKLHANGFSILLCDENRLRFLNLRLTGAYLELIQYLFRYYRTCKP